MKHIFTILLFLALGHFLKAQINSDVVTILNTTFSDGSVNFLSEKSYQMLTMNYGIPFIEKIEVRSETNDFDFEKQDLVVRVSPNNGANRNAFKSYHQSVQHMSKMEHETQIMKSLSDRYYLIIDFVCSKEKLDIEHKKHTVALDKVKLLKKMISLSSFDIVELIQAEDEINNLQRSIQRLDSHFQNVQFRISELIEKKEFEIKVEDIISVEEIKRIMHSKLNMGNENHQQVEVLSAKHYNSMMEHEWESTKTDFSIGFIQAKYGYEPNENFGNNFSLGIGFDFPLKGSARLNLNKLKMNILDSKSQYLMAKEEFERNVIQGYQKLNSLIDMHYLVKEQIEQGNADHALKEYSKQRMASPLAILKLTELNISNRSLLAEIKAEILTTYLLYIYSTGDIGIIPYKNFLDANLSKL